MTKVNELEIKGRKAFSKDFDFSIWYSSTSLQAGTNGQKKKDFSKDTLTSDIW